MDLKNHLEYVVRNAQRPEWDEYFMSFAILASSRSSSFYQPNTALYE